MVMVSLDKEVCDTKVTHKDPDSKLPDGPTPNKFKNSILRLNEPHIRHGTDTNSYYTGSWLASVINHKNLFLIP